SCCIRMQLEGKFQRRTELPLHENARRVGRKLELVEFSLVDAAEDDPCAGKQVLAIGQQKIQRRTHGSNSNVDFLAGVFRAKVVPQLSKIGVRLKSGKIHLLGVDLDRPRRTRT